MSTPRTRVQTARMAKYGRNVHPRFAETNKVVASDLASGAWMPWIDGSKAEKRASLAALCDGVVVRRLPAGEAAGLAKDVGTIGKGGRFRAVSNRGCDHRGVTWLRGGDRQPAPEALAWAAARRGMVSGR